MPDGVWWVRPAKTKDVPAIRSLVDCYTASRTLLAKATVTLYEDVQEFLVAEAPSHAESYSGEDPSVIGCGALHVLWEDLAEVRTLAVDPRHVGGGVGAAILTELLGRARQLGIRKVFCLTFEREFFAKFGFAEIEGTPVTHEVYAQLLQSYDEGVAEFLDLERVKPNTLGNHRMLLEFPQ